MFNKEESSKYIKGILNKNILFNKIGTDLVTSSNISLSKLEKKNKDFLDSHVKYEGQKIAYFNKVFEYQKKEYDEKIVDMYNNGIVEIDGVEYPLNDFFIKYNLGNKVELHLVCTGNEYTDMLTNSKKSYEYSGMIKFKDTTSFIDLLSSNAVLIINNKIVINNKDEVLKIINNWNGIIHSLVPKTDAIMNKQVFLRGEV